MNSLHSTPVCMLLLSTVHIILSMFILFALFICTCLFSAPSPCPFAPAACTFFAKLMRVVDTTLPEFLLLRRLTRSLVSPSCPRTRCANHTDLGSSAPSNDPLHVRIRLQFVRLHRPQAHADVVLLLAEQRPGRRGVLEEAAPRVVVDALRVAQEQRAHELSGGRAARSGCVARLAGGCRSSLLCRCQYARK